MRHRLVPRGLQIPDDLRPDQPGTADDCHLHDTPFVGITRNMAYAPQRGAGWDGERGMGVTGRDARPAARSKLSVGPPSPDP
ncbi:hypothetical protein GCM10010300_25160 [Streptomyces olivaceoviridis]|nr:hypothetical protein GCM10010300_25160 [Streptomyces olivaceoviridis]